MGTAPDWLQNFPELLAASHDPAIAELASKALMVHLPADRTVFQAGSACENYLMPYAGSVRVQLLTESGREVVLYHVGPGETCVLTTSCLLAGQHYPAEGITDCEVQAAALARPDFDRAVQRSEVFRRFVFDNFARRLAQVIARMEDIAFGSIDARLAAALLRQGPVLSTTHQALATELGSAREVVSRHLKRFEQEGWIRLGRGQIRILDPDRLSRVRRA